MKKEKQIGIRVGLPAFFALEVEGVYRRASGAHRALAFPDFLGLLIGLGLEEYCHTRGAKPEALESGDEPGEVAMFDMPRTGLQDLDGREGGQPWKP